MVNVAARLQAAAPAGEVLIGPETALAVSEVVGLRALGTVPAKGVDGGVRAWQVVPEGTGPTSDEHLFLAPPPFAGRDRDLAWLRARIAEPGSATLLVAPPGLGRTRLLRAVATELAGDGRTRAVLSLRVRADADDPYGPVADLFRAAARRIDPDADPAGTLRRLAADHAPDGLVAAGCASALALLAGTPLTSGPPELFAAWGAALDALDTTPSVWLIDDLHLASPDARSFHAHLVATAPRGRRLVATARPSLLVEEDAAADGQLVGRFGTVHHLRPLSRAALAEVLTAVLGADALPAPLRDRVLDAAAGTPMFVLELLRRWSRDGRLRRDDDGAWHLTGDDHDLDVPSTITALYTGELDGLPAEPRAVVSVASVPGLRFPEAALPVLGVDDPRPSLGALCAAGLLHPRPTVDAYVFRHPLLREAAYGGLLRRDRAGLHLRYAGWLRERTGPTPYAEIRAPPRCCPRRHLPCHLDGRRPGRARRTSGIGVGDGGARGPGQRARARGRTRGPGSGDRRDPRIVPAASRWPRRRRRRSGALVAAADAFARAVDLALAAPGRSALDLAVAVDAALGHEDRGPRRKDAPRQPGGRPVGGAAERRARRGHRARGPGVAAGGSRSGAGVA